jgi:hypothetical protein
VEEAEFELAGKMGTEKGMENEAFCKMGGGGVHFAKKYHLQLYFRTHF